MKDWFSLMVKGYSKKLEDIKGKFNTDLLSSEDKTFIDIQALKYGFSFQDFNIIYKIALDLAMWDEQSISQIWPDITNNNPKTEKKMIFKKLLESVEYLKNHKSYDDFYKNRGTNQISIDIEDRDDLGLGQCPVASSKTRCCNLLTLDAVESCGFDCSYCSIQSFYNQNRVSIDSNLKEKLSKLELDSNKRYHIGTGQSSDSLLWGNKGGILDAICEFAKENQNVILELKTKSKNIKYLLQNDIPKNIVCTFSLNTNVVVQNEEHKTASLDERINSAKELSKKGIKVGFHFHPMVQYSGYLSEYANIAKRLQKEFSPNDVVMVSMGTLTFTKSVMNQIRSRDFKSKILQMPQEKIAGKFSYPISIKKEMFKNLYDSFDLWHNDVFFYLCMEAHSLWSDCFGYEYNSNDEFEYNMLESYFNKVKI